MSTQEFEVVVFGGGNAVKVAMAAGAAGKRTALVEEGPLGGTCPNRGCIPSKLLIGYANVADTVRAAGRFHVEASLGAIDGAALLNETFTATRKTDSSLENALGDNVSLFRGRGTFVGEKTIEIDGNRIRGDAIVLATGGRPRAPTVPGLEGTPYWTSRDVFNLERLPESLVIVGGGYIGCEMAHFFNGVGVDTTVIQRGPELLGAEDEEIRPLFGEAFRKRIPTRLETGVTSVSHDGSRFRVELKGTNEETSSVQCEALLFAIGRVPNADAIGVDSAGIEVNGRGFVIADDRLRTSADGVYAMGDVIGRHMFTHSAALEAQYLSKVLLDGLDQPLDYGPMPHAVFSSPEIAGVGPTEQALRADGVKYLKASVPYTSAAKGRAVKEDHGLCKFLLDPEGKILGCHIVGHEASVLLHEVIPVMKWRNHISSITEIIHVHPALSEIVRNAARKAEALVA